MRYKIVETLIDVNLNSELSKIWEPFICDEDGEAIQIDLQMFPTFCYGIDVLNPESMKHALRSGEAVLFASEDWKEGRLYGNETDNLSALIEIQLYSHLLSKQSLLVHSSLVDDGGTGIMFIGPSGIGKTTQAELWQKHQNATILNGDLVFIRKNEDGFYGYGSPWHGSSHYYENRKVQIHKMVVLDQGSENILEKMEGFEAFNRCMQQTYMPHWDTSLMERAFDTIDTLSKSVSLYHLTCRPDEEAVQLVKKACFDRKILE